MRTGYVGQFVRCLALHPSPAVIAGGEKGIHISHDGGGHWVKVDTFPSYSLDVAALEVAGGAAVFALSSEGVLRSDDNGSSWRYVRKEANLSSVAAGAGGRVFLGTSHGIMRSTDSGDTWEQAAAPQYVIRSIDADQAGDVYAAYQINSVSWPRGILCSRDGGDTWETIELGAEGQPRQVLVSPGGETAVVVHTSGALSVSSDAFMSWEPISPPPRRVTTAAFSPDGCLFLYDSVYQVAYRTRLPLF
jgi:photosystem II stability/assembly factor-like uncharacterized protein